MFNYPGTNLHLHLYTTGLSNWPNLHPYQYSRLHIKPVQKTDDDFLGMHEFFIYVYTWFYMKPNQLWLCQGAAETSQLFDINKLSTDWTKWHLTVLQLTFNAFCSISRSVHQIVFNIVFPEVAAKKICHECVVLCALWSDIMFYCMVFPYIN